MKPSEIQVGMIVSYIDEKDGKLESGSVVSKPYTYNRRQVCVNIKRFGGYGALCPVPVENLTLVKESTASNCGYGTVLMSRATGEEFIIVDDCIVPEVLERHSEDNYGETYVLCTCVDSGEYRLFGKSFINEILKPKP